MIVIDLTPERKDPSQMRNERKQRVFRSLIRRLDRAGNKAVDCGGDVAWTYAGRGIFHVVFGDRVDSDDRPTDGDVQWAATLMATAVGRSFMYRRPDKPGAIFTAHPQEEGGVT